MTATARLDQAAAGLRRYADELGSAFHGLPALAAEAWACPAATAFDAQLRVQIAVLSATAGELRATAAAVEAAAAAQAAAAEQAVAGLPPDNPVAVDGPAPLEPVPVGGPR